MKTTLTLLGTAGGPTPKRTRSAPSQAITVGDRVYLVDCGNGVARQMALAELPLEQLRALFITHHHSDHNADYGNVLLLSWGSNLITPVHCYGPPPLQEMTNHFLALNSADIDIRIHDEGRPELRPLIKDTEVRQPGVVYEDDRVRVSAALVDHPPFTTALAYRFDTPDRSIVISGDTAYCPELINLAEGADVLVHEVLYPEALDWMIQRSNGTRLRQHLVGSHTSVDEVGKVAAAAGVGTLVLSHFVPSDADISDDAWRQRASAGYDGKVIVGRDLLTI